MPATQPALLNPQQGLSIYRQILRECSYLPPAIRPTIQATIQKRFQQHREHDDPRAKQRWARAQNVLRTLRSANNGHGKRMEGLISKAFGRSGVRRRQLMSAFVTPQGVSDSKTLEAATTGDESAAAPDWATTRTKAGEKKKIGNPKNRFHLKWDQQKLLRLLSSQRDQQSDGRSTSHLMGAAVKSVNPDVDVPKQNIWGNPPAECVVNAKRARWWRRSAEKMLPPLGKGEWELLARLSQGAQESSEWQRPERRIAVDGTQSKGQQRAELTEETAELMRYAAHPAATVERWRSSRRMLPGDQRDAGPFGVSRPERELSPRWFRRAYNRAWVLTPKMEQDPNTLKYKFTWGQLPGSRIRAANPRQQAIFEGVDAKGRPLSKPPAK